MKKLLILLLMATTTISQAQDGKAETEKKTFSRTTSVSINIKADKSIIWTLMTQAHDIPRWNSTIISLEGKIEKGEKIKLKSTVDSSRTFSLKVVSFTEEKEMVWSDGFAPFFKGVRTYTLTKNENGSCTFTMHEKLKGITFPMAASSIPSFDESFEQFAKDLKIESEKIQNTKD